MMDMLPPGASRIQVRRPPVPPDPHAGADPRTEYVSGSPRLFVSRFVESLPPYIDDITADFGADIYERMILDPQCYSCVQVFKTAILSSGAELRPAVEDKDNPDYQLAKDILDFCDDNFENTKPLDSFLYEMLDCTYLGHKLAEQTYETARHPRNPNRYSLNLVSVKTKPRGTFSFVVDAFYNLFGVLGLVPGMGSPVLAGHIVADPRLLPNLLPKEKFVIMTYNPENSRPQGRSILRAAYNPWWGKMQIWGEYLRHLAQFGTPSILAKAAPDAVAKAPTDAYGNPTGAVVSPEQYLVNILEMIRNGSVAAVPAGTEVDMLNPPPAGGVFDAAFSFFDRQIAKGVLGQTLATEEGEHMARAASETHKDILDVVVRHGRDTAKRMVRDQMLRPLVMYNYGPMAAARLCPRVTIGGAEEEDWHKDAAAIAGLVSSKFLHPSQYKALDERLKLPPREEAGAAGDDPESETQPLAAFSLDDVRRVRKTWLLSA